MENSFSHGHLCPFGKLLTNTHMHIHAHTYKHACTHTHAYAHTHPGHRANLGRTGIPAIEAAGKIYFSLCGVGPVWGSKTELGHHGNTALTHSPLPIWPLLVTKESLFAVPSPGRLLRLRETSTASYTTGPSGQRWGIPPVRQGL